MLVGVWWMIVLGLQRTTVVIDYLAEENTAYWFDPIAGLGIPAPVQGCMNEWLPGQRWRLVSQYNDETQSIDLTLFDLSQWRSFILPSLSRDGYAYISESPNGMYLLLRVNGDLRLLDAATMEVVAERELEVDIGELYWQSDNAAVYSQTWNREVTIAIPSLEVSVRNFDPMVGMELDSYVNDYAVAPDGRAFIGRFLTQRGYQWYLRTEPDNTWQFVAPASYQRAVWSPDGSRIAFTYEELNHRELYFGTRIYHVATRSWTDVTHTLNDTYINAEERVDWIGNDHLAIDRFYYYNSDMIGWHDLYVINLTTSEMWTVIDSMHEWGGNLRTVSEDWFAFTYVPPPTYPEFSDFNGPVPQPSSDIFAYNVLTRRLVQITDTPEISEGFIQCWTG